MRKFAAVLAGLAATVFLPLEAYSRNVWDNAYSNSKPMFTVLPKHAAPTKAGDAQLPQWTGTFTDRTGKVVSYTMVGTDPAIENGGVATIVPVVIVPVAAVYGQDNGNKTFDPMKHKVSNGQTVVENTLNSPVFSPLIDFVQGGTDLGTTQYLDAFQRGNFWNASVASNPAYHVLLSAVLGNELKINVSARQGQVIQNPFGHGVVGTMDINAFDQQLQAYVQNFAGVINPGVLPVFLTYNVFLTAGGGCCVGGYRSANGGPPGGQTYVYATYHDSQKSFAEDVAALAHELGSWMDDPFMVNRVNCTNIGGLDVAGVLTGNRHVYAYTANNFTYHLPSLVFLDYFGAPKSVPVNHWLSFQNDEGHRCGGQ